MLLEEEDSRDLWDVMREMYETGASHKGAKMKTKHFKVVCSECGSEDVVIAEVLSCWKGESSKRLVCKKCGVKETI